VRRSVDNGNVVISETLNLTTNVSNTIGINIPTVNTTKFPAKTVAGNYVVKLDRLTPTPLHTLPAVQTMKQPLLMPQVMQHLQVVVVV
jgi:hypothetical protein